MSEGSREQSATKERCGAQMSNNSSEGDGPDVRSVGPRIERPRDEQWLTRSKLQVVERWLNPMTLRKGDGPGT